MKIRAIRARQIFDSRGLPTLEAMVELEDGSIGVGSAPSGASTGSHEALEKRDGGDAYFGKGVRGAVEGVNTRLNSALAGLDADEQAELDARMLEEDDSPNKAELGGNAMIAVSLAAADAAAKSHRMELFQWLGGAQARELPCPMFNVINGGRHAGNNLEMQEFMLVPVGAGSFREAMRMGAECYHALRELLSRQGFATAVGDEGGFAPDFDRDEDALDFLLRAVESAGWRPGEDVCLALDAAASEWMGEEDYVQLKSARRFSRQELMAYYRDLAARYPLISIEDPLDEEDFEGFRSLTDELGEEMMIVGDDLFTTNAARLRRGASLGAANAILIKPNQIGTLTETFETIRLARRSGYTLIVSHRSGETQSSAIADIAVAVGAEYIKAGAPARGERLAKYNRLLRIEDMLNL